MTDLDLTMAPHDGGRALRRRTNRARLREALTQDPMQAVVRWGRSGSTLARPFALGLIAGLVFTAVVGLVLWLGQSL